MLRNSFPRKSLFTILLPGTACDRSMDKGIYAGGGVVDGEVKRNNWGYGVDSGVFGTEIGMVKSMGNLKVYRFLVLVLTKI